VSTLMHRWGCRWYLPTDLGECLPEVDRLAVGDLDIAYAPPFEVRSFWISWNGATEGKDVFMRRNFFNDVRVPSGHNLAAYTADLVPPGKSVFQVPIAEPATARHVAEKVAALHAAGKDIQLGMEDGVYESESPLDRELFGLRFDKYFLKPSATDAFLTFYNQVARLLREHHPRSASKIGFLAYANMTLPPVRVRETDPSLVAYLAPIDIDPIHPMDSPLSAPRRELRDIVHGWAKVLKGRVVIYDYDQSMMVWRDIPAPCLPMFRSDVKEFEKAGILGVDTECRGALATTFTNLFHRGQLLWNPRIDSDALEARFHADFFGPAAAPMRAYWKAILDAWAGTIATEHEIHLFPAVYTPAVVETLRAELGRARATLAPIARAPDPTPKERRLLERFHFVETGFEVLHAYHRMRIAAAEECDYPAAVGHGERGLAARERLADANDWFTTYRRIGESGAAWWPGEVEQIRVLARRTGGDLGTLVARLPAAWAFRTDPDDIGQRDGWAIADPGLPPWDGNAPDWRAVRAARTRWQWLLASSYIQAQGIIDESHQGFTGIGWYRIDIDLDRTQAARRLRLMFPGLFNGAALHVNGKEIARRTGYQPVWWHNAYEFEWDVDVAGKLVAGRNRIALRIDNPHHMGGMFRRPFLYEPK